MSDTITSVRLPGAVLRRAKKLADRLRHAPEFTAFRMSRSAVLRLAVLAGLEHLEQRHRNRAGVDNQRKLTLKVSPKGAVSVYGLGKWPVTLYREQWLRLLEVADDVRAFIASNRRDLKSAADGAKKK